MSEKRLNYIDNIKAIGITLVVAGHIIQRSNADVIYLFHMPLFFFLSGYLFTPQENKKYIAKKFNHLLIPYLFFLFSILALNSILNLSAHDGDMTTIYKSFTRAIYGGERLKGVFAAYWFVTVLFFSQITLNYLKSKTNDAILFFIVLILYAAAFINQFYLPNKTLPLDLNVCLYAIPLMYAGLLCRNNNSIFKLLSSFGLLSLLIQLNTTMNISNVDLKIASYGYPVLSTLSAIFIVYLIFFISKLIPENIVLSTIGNASMTIMFTHQWFHLFLLQYGVINCSVLIALTLLASIIIHQLLDKSKTGRRLYLGTS